MTILDEIIVNKRKEVAKLKESVLVTSLESSYYFKATVNSLSAYLLHPERTGIIAEFKRKSPSKGWINKDADVQQITMQYALAGASGLSVLTDTDFFGGSIEDLSIARKANEIPILRKEFVVDEFQILQAKSYGADAILLIASCLTIDETLMLAKFAQSLGLEVLLEIHNEQELQHINSFVNIVGVNNRDLKTFQVSLDTSLHLVNKIPNPFIKISESGITCTADIHLLSNAGFHGFLIGERFMHEANPGLAFNDFVKSI